MLLDENYDTPVSRSRSVPLSEKVFGVWRRRKSIGIPIFIVLAILFALYVANMPDIYQASATILVERQKVPEAFVQSTVTSGIDNRWLTMNRQILSHARLEDLINRFGLYPDLRQKGLHLDQIIGRMRDDIQVTQATPSRIRRRKNRNRSTIAFTVSYRSPNAEQAVQVTDTLSSYYIEENIKSREEQATGTAEFLNTELIMVKEQLEKQELQLSKFRERNMGELPSQLEANQTALERVSDQLRFNQERQALLGERRAVLANQLVAAREQEPLGAVQRPTPTPSASDEDRAQLELLREQLVALQSTFNDNYPDVKALKKKIASHEQRLAQTPVQTPVTRIAPSQSPRPESDFVRQLQAEHEQLAAELKALNTQERNLLASINQLQRRIENTPQHERQLQILTRNYETTKSLYKSLLEREKEAKLAKNFEQRHQGEQFRLIEPTTLGRKPVGPNRQRLVGLGLFLASAVALLSMWFCDLWNTALHSFDEFRAFYHSRTPILVSLPYIATPAETRRQRWRSYIAAAITCVGLILVAISAYVALKGKDQFYDLVQSL